MKGPLHKTYVVVDYGVIPMQDKKVEKHCRITCTTVLYDNDREDFITEVILKRI